MNKRLLFIFAFVLLSCCIYGQRTHSLEIKLSGGKIIPHRLNMKSLAQPTVSGEINYYFTTHTDNFYDVKYRFPKQGFGISYNYIWDHNVLGSAIAAYSFMDFSLFERQWFGLGLRANAGIAYMTRKYNVDTNPENIAVSTNLCFHLNVSLNEVFKLPSGYEIKLSQGFMHYSNGNVLKPNLGLNDIFVSAALSKDIQTCDYTKQRTDYQDNLSPHEAWIMGTCATSDEFSYDYNGRGGGYICSTAAVGYCYQYGKIGKVGASFDMLYDENRKYFYYHDERGVVQLFDDFFYIVKFGVSVGHQLVYRRFELITYLGFYVYNRVWAYDWVYTRIGARYYVTDFMFLNLTLHANGFKARYIESGIGFSWRRWKKSK